MRKYAVHPGRVQSTNDGDWHNVTGAHLVRLYGLRSGEYIVWPRSNRGLQWDDYDHLYPLRDGNYEPVRGEIDRRRESAS